MLPVQRELAALKFIDGLSAHLKDAGEPHKALRHALRDTREFFRATHGCIATLRAGHAEADLLFTLPRRVDWDLGVLTRYIRHTHPPVQRDMLIGSVRRRGGAWGAIALVAPGHAFDRADRRLIARIAAVLSAAVQRIDRDRLLGVRDRIDRKIMEQIHPKDLFYQIMDGIRSLTLYDHSSALLIRFRASPARAPTSAFSFQRRCRNRTCNGHETGAHPRRGRRTGNASCGRARAERRPSRYRHAALSRCAVGGRRVSSGARDPRYPDAGSRRLRADGAAESAVSGARRDPDDGQRRRSGRETGAGHPQPCLLLHPEAVRS